MNTREILDNLVSLAYSAAATEHAFEQRMPCATQAAKDTADDRLVEAFNQAIIDLEK